MVQEIQEIRRQKAAPLETAYSLQLLIVLLDESEPINKGVLIGKMARGKSTVQQRIADLVTMGLVRETVETTHPFRHYVTLSPKGRRAATHLRDMIDLV